VAAATALPGYHPTSVAVKDGTSMILYAAVELIYLSDQNYAK
jgi:hypothetical protein